MNMPTKTKSIIEVVCSEQSQFEKAAQIAAQLGYPLNTNEDAALQIIVNDQQIAIRDCNDPKTKPLTIDFTQGALAYRRQASQPRDELLARACGVKGKHRPFIIDATAGLGRDGFMLATFGCRVLMLERSPLLVLMLKEALNRYREKTHDQKLALDIRHADSVAYLGQLPVDTHPDVIYLDPMHPPRKKGTVVKKAMRIIRHLVGDDVDAPKLLKQALAKAGKRVVVKLPRHGKSIALQDRLPDYNLAGRSTRYDVYL